MATVWLGFCLGGQFRLSLVGGWILCLTLDNHFMAAFSFMLFDTGPSSVFHLLGSFLVI